VKATGASCKLQAYKPRAKEARSRRRKARALRAVIAALRASQLLVHIQRGITTNNIDRAGYGVFCHSSFIVHRCLSLKSPTIVHWLCASAAAGSGVPQAARRHCSLFLEYWLYARSLFPIPIAPPHALRQ
jgi:hypothetical protein